MHIADLTLTPMPALDGGDLLARHRRLSAYPDVQHSVLVPGARHAYHEGIYQIPATRLPFCGGRRLPLRRGPWSETLLALRPDLIEVGNPFLPAWVALEVAGALDVPVVGRHDGAAGAPRRYLAGLYARFDRVLVASRTLMAPLEALGLDNLVLQRPGVDLARYSPRRGDGALRRGLGLDERTRLLVHLDPRGRGRRLDGLLAALRLLGRPYHLLLAGSALPRRLPDNVTALRRDPTPAEAARLLASADAFVHVDAAEPSGRIALQAMACGTPVVAPQGGAFAEVVPESLGRLYRPGAPRELAQAVQARFEADPARLGQAARRPVEAHHAWDGAVAALLMHYQSLCAPLCEPVAVPG